MSSNERKGEVWQEKPLPTNDGDTRLWLLIDEIDRLGWYKAMDLETGEVDHRAAFCFNGFHRRFVRIA